MIIDSHVHIGGAALNFNMTEEIVCEVVKKYGIDMVLLSDCDAGEMDHHQKLVPVEWQIPQIEILKKDLEIVRRHKDIMRLLVWVRPYNETVTKEFDELIGANLDVIKGIKLHPFHSNTAPDSEKARPYLELAQKYGLPVVSHTGGCEAASPIHLYNAAIMFPKIDFVMVHMGLGTDNKEALDLLGKAPNLYGDTTWVPLTTTLEAYKRYGSKKMIFGSDMPIDGVDTYKCNPKCDPSVYVQYFKGDLGLMPKEAWDDLYFGNAKRIFEI